MGKKKFYNPQTNIFDFRKKQARSWDWYDKIWKTVNKCAFCDLNERYVIFEKNGIVLTANLYPYIDAHLLIIPRRHVEYVKELTKEEWDALRGIMYVAKKVLRRVFKKKSLWFLYREGALGEGQKTVGHLHVQVIPYKEGLVKWDYQPINWAPGEVGDRLKEEKNFMEGKYEKYILKYGAYAQTERRIVVNCLIRNSKGEVLLVKKKISLKNQWETPAGSVEGDESLIQALQREMKEEVNLSIKNVKFIGIEEDRQRVFFEGGFEKDWNLIFLNYTAEVKSGRLKAGDDTKEAKWVDINKLQRYKLSNITKRIIKKLFTF
ncbi:NUDIX domain-containing protein [Candidatus Dojkabacteria bacterium]|nr:NUDIX domain-containing protein [Candidatus Dojkabacteria bacterium]